ncbi:MAG: SDR family NAD(P)-dependent oxidoreductase [Actinomycetota bacterium]|nr:SDR family NAD(P)-dependent oxidoreductase [Actinomycetota bacterium]
MVDFTDRVAIVTGAGGGLGREHAKLLASLGAAVVINDLGGDVHGAGSGTSPADAVVDEIRATGGAAVADHASVSDPEAAASIVERAVAEFGRIDVVVNNAGILRDKTFANLEWGDLAAVLDVHLKGAFYVTQPAFAHMKAQGYGRIVVTSSASGLLGNFGQTNYGAAKMGLIGLMQVLKLEAARYGITVNAVAPIANTRMTTELLGDGAQLFDAALVSPAVAYLASEACTLSGEVWSVGGGSVSRFFVGLTPGWFRHPDRGPITVDDIATNVEAIRAEAGYLVPYSSGDEFTKLGKLLGG